MLESDVKKMGLSGAEAEEKVKKCGEDGRLRDLVDRLGIRIGLVPVTVRMYSLSLSWVLLAAAVLLYLSELYKLNWKIQYGVLMR